MDAAEAWCGVEASNLKRDAQKATKRSWDDFESGGGGAAAAVKAAPTEGGARPEVSARASNLVSNSSSSSKSKSGSVLAGPASGSPPDAGSGGAGRDKAPPLPSSSLSAASAAAAGSASAAHSPAGGRPKAPPASLPVTRMHESVEHPEVVAARSALEKAQELIGVELPSLDKGPEPDCVLCHVPRGAFLRAERGAKLGWCHTLCAFSKGLVIEDRVVKVGWVP